MPKIVAKEEPKPEPKPEPKKESSKTITTYDQECEISKNAYRGQKKVSTICFVFACLDSRMVAAACAGAWKEMFFRSNAARVARVILMIYEIMLKTSHLPVAALQK